MSKSPAQRKADQRQRDRDAGLVYVTVKIPLVRKQELLDYSKKLEKNMKSHEFAKPLTTSVAEMKAAVIAAGGSKWGETNDEYIVEFDDGSYFSAAVFYPEDSEPYYNGSAKINPNKVDFPVIWRHGEYVPL